MAAAPDRMETPRPETRDGRGTSARPHGGVAAARWEPVTAIRAFGGGLTGCPRSREPRPPPLSASPRSSSTGRHDFRAGWTGRRARRALSVPDPRPGGRRGARGPELVDNRVGRAAAGLVRRTRRRRAPRFNAWLDQPPHATRPPPVTPLADRRRAALARSTSCSAAACAAGRRRDG